ncbi:hypothetical protein [Halospeciosus flavus]|uniref:Tat (Twin-arginine translocation) pathway signal sequence n=1 Tax=Halospeciosus flavus TaxID=3032283 RepID=A0ABD5Z7Z5_9EURY|nr:hypothetical protein [Halospeciosus flavus]
MERRRFLATAGAAFGGLAGCSAPTKSPRRRLDNGSFEAGLRSWSVGTDLPTDPNTGGPVETDVRVTGERASSGERALELSIDGRQDDGMVWVQQPVDLGHGSTLAVDVYSPQESFNTITKVAAFAGPDRVLRESEFDTSRAVEDHGGWKTFEYPVDGDGLGVVAVGISVVWETEVTRWVDDVRLVD